MKFLAALGTAVLLLGSLATVQAADFANRGGVPLTGVVQQGQTKVTFERETMDYRNGFILELQYVQRANEAPYTLVHIWAEDAYDTAEIVSPSGKTVVLTEDPSLRHAGADPKVDRWYRVDMNDLLQLDNPDKCEVRLQRPNGKYFTVTARRLLRQARQATGQLLPNDEVREQTPYGPTYSVFFPHTSWQTVRTAMAYYLNRRTDVMADKIYRRGRTHYMLLSTQPMLVFFAEGQSGHGIAQYRETPDGTWVDLDFWTNWSDQYGYHEFSRADDEVVNIGMSAVERAYKALLPHADYGLTLNGGLNKKGPTIDTIDVTNHPELAAVSHSDKVISVNGMAMSQAKNYEVSYMLTYGTKPLTLVLQNDKQQQYTVTVQPKDVAPTAGDTNFQAVLDTEKGLHMKEKQFMYYWPLTVPGFEVFDPADTAGHVESPITGPLYQALQ